MKYGFFKPLVGVIAFLLIMPFNEATAIGEHIDASPGLLDLTDRGSKTKTPYVLTPYATMLEAGYQSQHFKPDDAWDVFPQLVLFLGLPEQSELILELPTYNQQPQNHLSGFGQTVLGLKHELAHGGNWMASAHLFFDLPSGNDVFGTQNVGVHLSGMIGYEMNSMFTLGVMFGPATLTDPPIVGGGRFNAFNASAVLTCAPTEQMHVFAELFGQTKTNVLERGNFNVDYGILYLLKPNVALDLEAGQQLSHVGSAFRNFINGGITLQF